MQPTVSPVAEALNHQGDYSVLAQQHPPVFHPSCSAHRPVSNISRQSRVVCRPHQLKPAGLTDVNAASCVQQCHAIPECRGSSPLPKKEISLDLCKSHESSLRRVGPQPSVASRLLLTGSGRPRTSRSSVVQRGAVADCTVDQWPAHFCELFKPKADILNICCD